MKLKEICDYLNSEIPLSFQEEYDNSGLQVGIPDMEISSALVTLDVTEDVLEEAAAAGCNLIISHHPLIFYPLKKITHSTYTEKIIFSAIKKNIAIYSAHTNLDSFPEGVSHRMALKLGLKNITVLSPLKNRLLKLVTFVPDVHLPAVRQALFDAGAGVTGKYDQCSFSVGGTGSFRAGDGTNPFVGEKHTLHFESESRLETVFHSHLKNKVVRALLDAHPYEEVAYDIYSLENESADSGSGCLGELDDPLPVEGFIRLLSEVFDAKGIRYSGYDKKIKRVALCGGSGSHLLGEAIASGADSFVTGDVKYHTFQSAGKEILLVDCGHYETEKFSAEILAELVIKKFPKFAVRFSKINTNPINYLRNG
ncbi:MAG TPA: Nif3-like dinuclear metal center hexameric protein [Bacteroidales bacterium]|nr:Nif3-like dinuclear metal center hexameric protein [Bacteroidales bacterium]HNR42292.1 Nif3-like dinuclear metal center hexameric protein [Bacteroidales bacterium]HQG76377.1 Nif3-like dinuclear metal center hexameric protein [Bacteroidales bacterium]